MTDTKRTKPGSLILLGVAFILPVVLAKIALDNEWFTRGSTNKGELLQPVIQADPLLSSLSPKWRIVYTLPETCDAECENALFSIQQVWLALGKESDRAEPLVIVTTTSDQGALKQLEQSASLKILSASDKDVNKVFNSLSADGIFLVDTMNNAMLRYPLFEQQQDAILHSRDMLADLRKLLKLSRIG